MRFFTAATDCRFCVRRSAPSAWYSWLVRLQNGRYFDGKMRSVHPVLSSVSSSGPEREGSGAAVPLPERDAAEEETANKIALMSESKPKDCAFTTSWPYMSRHEKTFLKTPRISNRRWTLRATVDIVVCSRGCAHVKRRNLQKTIFLFFSVL